MRQQPHKLGFSAAFTCCCYLHLCTVLWHVLPTEVSCKLSAVEISGSQCLVCAGCTVVLSTAWLIISCVQGCSFVVFSLSKCDTMLDWADSWYHLCIFASIEDYDSASTSVACILDVCHIVLCMPCSQLSISIACAAMCLHALAFHCWSKASAWGGV
jgi:hypothetical protein